MSFGYTDPYEAAWQARQSMPQPGVSSWPQEPVSPIEPFPVVPQAPVGGPLADLPNQVASVFQGAAPQGVRREPMAESWLKGAALGLGSALAWRAMKRRKAIKGEWMSPGFRALALLLGFPAVGLALSMLWIPESGYLVSWGCVLGAVSFIAYTAYRACGGGRYNSRRCGSPWRDDHRRGRHRAY
jgi:hypothetical protein